MGKLTALIVIIAISAPMACFLNGKNNAPAENGITLEVSYEHGTNLSPKAWKNIYVVWIENQESAFLQNIIICRKLIDGGLTGTALPYWKFNKYPKSDKYEIDAVTGATKANTDFTETAKIKDSKIRKFTVYFELDRSFDGNSWFPSDQPSLLYKADIDLDSPVNEYELKPYGWTPDKDITINKKTFLSGDLQKELRYITNLKSGTGFGSIDTLNSGTKMVKKITVKVVK